MTTSVVDLAIKMGSFGWTATSTPTPKPSTASSTTPWVPVATLAAAIIAAIVAGLTAYLQRKSSREVAAAAEASALAKRYEEAVASMGSEVPMRRMAGIYAMVRLADDWFQQRAVCVEMLCAYLRLHPSEDVKEQEIHRTIVSIFSERLDKRKLGQPTGWHDLYFDLSNTKLRDFRMASFHFNKAPNFSGVQFEGDCFFSYGVLADGAKFDQATVVGSFDFEPTLLEHSHVDMNGFAVAQNAKATLRCRDMAHGSMLIIDAPKFLGMVEIVALSQDQDAGTIQVSHAEVGEHAGVTIRGSRWAIEDPKKVPEVVAVSWFIRESQVTIDQKLIDAGRLTWDFHDISAKAQVKFI